MLGSSLPKWCYYICQQLCTNQGGLKALVTMLKSPVLRSHGKDTFDFLCSTYHFKAVFLEEKLGPHTEFGSVSDRTEALTFVSLIAKRFYTLKHMVKPFNA